MQLQARFSHYAALALLIAACSGDQGAPPSTTASASASDASPSTAADTTAPSTTTTTIVTTTTTSLDSSYRWEVGDCLRFGDPQDIPYEPFGSELVTTCGNAHTHEMYHTGMFAGDENAAYPQASIDAEINETCIGTFIDFTGVLPVQTELDILMYLPDADEWASGLRYQGCLLYSPAGLGSFRELTGSVAGRGEDFTLDVAAGDCLAIPSVKVPPVDCSRSHLAEVIGTVTHPGENGDPYPGGAELELFAIRECDVLRSDYVVENQLAGPTVAIARGFSELEWESGWRELRCMAFVLSPDGEIATVTGSFAEAGWNVDEGGQAA